MKTENIRISYLLSRGLILLIVVTCAESLAALTFPLPSQGDIIGAIQTTKTRQGESLADLGRRYNVGVYEMIEANPGVDPWTPPNGVTVIIPTQYILPPGPRHGLVLNLSEMRLYYYHVDRPMVTTVPIGIGRKSFPTPLGVSTVVNKKKDPSWNPPASIRREHLAKGEILPAVVPGGPDNPMGRYALYLSVGDYRIHGTNRPGGVGLRVSHGCVRCMPEDIERLYHMVPVGTQVRIIHAPYKIGWHNNRLYLEAHQPLTEGKFAGSNSLDKLENLIQQHINGSYSVNWASAKATARSAHGYPKPID